MAPLGIPTQQDDLAVPVDMQDNGQTTKELASSSPNNGEPSNSASVPEALLGGESVDERTTIPEESKTPNHGTEQSHDSNSRTESVQEPTVAQRVPSAQETSKPDAKSSLTTPYLPGGPASDILSASAPNENVYHTGIRLPNNEAIPLLETVTIDRVLSRPKRTNAWLDWILISLWLLSNVALYVAIYIVAQHMDWSKASIIAAAPIVNHPDGIFRYLDIPLSLTQAKSIDFAMSAVIGPMLIAMANLIWFKLGRFLSLLEEASAEITTNPETKRFDSGSYDLSRLSKLLKSSTPRNLLFAVLLLTSALSATLLCNTLAYKAIPGSTPDATAGEDDGLHYQMVYIPGLLFLALCNISIASTAALALVFNARRSNAAQEKQQAVDLANIFGEPTSLNAVAGVEPRSYFDISLPKIPAFLPFSWHLPMGNMNTYNVNTGELEPLLPVSERIELTPRKKSGSKWSFFNTRYTSTDRKTPFATSHELGDSEESEPRSPVSEHWQWYRIPLSFRFWNFGYSSNLRWASDVKPVAEASYADRGSSDEVEGMIVAESSRAARKPIGQRNLVEAFEMPRVADSDESAPRIVWTYWPGSFKFPWMFKSRETPPYTSEIQIARNSGANTRVGSMREASETWNQSHFRMPQYTLPSHLEPARDLESQIEAPHLKTDNPVEQDTQKDMTRSARLKQSSFWGLPRFSAPRFPHRGAAKPVNKSFDERSSNSMKINVEQRRGRILEAAKHEDPDDIKQINQWIGPSTPSGSTKPSASDFQIHNQAAPIFGRNMEPPKRSSPSRGWALGGVKIPPLSGWSYQGSPKGKGKEKEVSPSGIPHIQPSPAKGNATRYYSWSLPHVIEYSSSRKTENHQSSGGKGKQRENYENITEDSTQAVQSTLPTEDAPSAQEHPSSSQPANRSALTKALATHTDLTETQHSAQNNERNWWSFGWTGPHLDAKPTAKVATNTETTNSTERLAALNYFGHLPSPTTEMRFNSPSGPSHTSHSRIVKANSSSSDFLSVFTQDQTENSTLQATTTYEGTNTHTTHSHESGQRRGESSSYWDGFDRAPLHEGRS